MTLLTVQADTNEFRFGTQSLRVITGDTGNNALYPADPVNVVAGTAYTFSCYIKTSGVLGAGVKLRIAQGGLLTPALFESALVTDSSTYEDSVNGWTRMILTFTVPEGVLTVRPIILYTGTTLGEVFWIDGLLFEEGDTASVWAQNIVSKRLVLDQGAVQVDASEGGLLRLRGSLGGARDTVSLGEHGLLFGSDTEVYSPAAGEFRVNGPAAATAAAKVVSVAGQRSTVKVTVDGDTFDRTVLFGDATLAGLELGPGNAARDVVLSRSAANNLKLAAGDVFEAEKVNMTGVTSNTTFVFTNGGTAVFANKRLVWSRLGPWVFWRLSFDVTTAGSGTAAVSIAGTETDAPSPSVITYQPGGRSGTTADWRARISASTGLSIALYIGTVAAGGVDLVVSTYYFGGVYHTDDAF